MKEVLQRLNTVNDVLGAAFFNPSGACVAAFSADHVREQELIEIGPVVATLLSSQTGRHVAASETAIFRFERGVVAVKRMRAYSLVVLCKPNADLTTGGAGFHIAVASRLLAIHTSRIPPHASATMPIVREIEEAAPALRAGQRVPRL